MTNAITATAAVAAAIFSLVNVLLSNRFARTTQVQQWRRDSVRKTISEFLDTTREFITFYQRVVDKIVELEDESGHKPKERLEEVRADTVWNIAGIRTRAQHLLSELQLVASFKCVRAGYQLFERLDDDMMFGLFGQEDEQSAVVIHRRLTTVIELARDDFVLACRADLGVDHRRRRQKPVRFRASS